MRRANVVHRRRFLALALAAGGVLLTRTGRALAWVPVPPSVMLHARQDHLDHLPRFLDWLLDEGYTPITYRTLFAALTARDTLPRKPVIISIDDLTLVRGSINYPFIARMVSLFLERELPVVVAIVTEPVLQGASGHPVQLTDQDDAAWAHVAEWAACGVELATHTQTHKNLVDVRMACADYEREIGGSAAMIEARAAPPVATLVLPFGNAMVGGRHGGTLHEPIVAACRAAGIGMIVGVAGGRDPLVPVAGTEPPVYFAGRVGPLTGDFRSIYSDVAHWQATNERACAHPAIP